MSAGRRFYPMTFLNKIAKFRIDTTKIVSGATNGSENPLTFRMPTLTDARTKYIQRVSDGRPDVLISSSDNVITFSTPGVYDITLIGQIYRFNFSSANGYDKLKITNLYSFGGIRFNQGAFTACTNLVVEANDIAILPLSGDDFFRSIKEYKSDLGRLNTSSITSFFRMIGYVQTPLTSTLPVHFPALTTYNQPYLGSTFNASVTTIELHSDSLLSINNPIIPNSAANSSKILIFKTPNLTTLSQVVTSSNCPSLGGVDVRSVNVTTNWATVAMAQSRVDITLLGWAQLPYMQSGVTWDWKNAKYSNNPAVIAAYNKITTTWGVIFTNLTMA